MTTQRAVYLALFLILLAAFLVGGGSTLWTAVSLRGRLPTVKPIDAAIEQACNDLADQLAKQARFGTFGPAATLTFEPAPAAGGLDTYAQAVNTWFSLSMAKRAAAAGKPFALKFLDGGLKFINA